MTMSFHRETAKIYQFPIRKLASRNDRAKWMSPAIEHTAQSYARTTFGSGWYHDAAIAEDERKQTS